MNRRAFLAAGVALLAAPLAAEAQQAGKVYRVGVLHLSNPGYPQVFEQALRQRGWIPGQNVLIEYRVAQGDVERLPQLAAELVALHVDVIKVLTEVEARAVQRLSTTIPVVFSTEWDPVGAGLAHTAWRDPEASSLESLPRWAVRSPASTSKSSPRLCPRSRA